MPPAQHVFSVVKVFAEGVDLTYFDISYFLVCECELELLEVWLKVTKKGVENSRFRGRSSCSISAPCDYEA